MSDNASSDDGGTMSFVASDTLGPLIDGYVGGLPPREEMDLPEEEGATDVFPPWREMASATASFRIFLMRCFFRPIFLELRGESGAPESLPDFNVPVW